MNGCVDMKEVVFNKGHVLFDEKSSTQDEAFERIAELANELGFVTSSASFERDLKEREAEATTGFKDGIAIPHGKSNDVLKSGVFVIKYSNPIEWNALDQKPVEVAIALTIPEEGGQEHLKILSKISRKLLDKEFIRGLKESTNTDEIVNIINEIE